MTRDKDHRQSWKLYTPPRLFVSLVVLLVISGCGAGNNGSPLCRVITPTDAVLITHHVTSCHDDLYNFVSRLYARNPKYEQDLELRRHKIDAVFRVKNSPLLDEFSGWTSDRFLVAAFAAETRGDRVFLLGLGLANSIREAYGLEEMTFFWSGLQIPVERLKRLHFNLSQVNWRLKTYKDASGELLFLSNGMGENGYLNMGYEVIMTRILTRIEDDIYLRGGLPDKYAFRMSTLFLSILM
ncbi:MAG: hypothetical protein V1706_10195 [Pseudomonadota bacterium]